MSLFNSLFNQGSFIPDYRDTILFNGYLPCKATGIFKANLIEFAQISDPLTIIYFNSNLSRLQYVENHDRFEIFRNKNLSDFSHFTQTRSNNLYVPTGRWFFSKHAKLWELMKINDPMEVVYQRDMPYSESDFVFGPQCVHLPLNGTTILPKNV